MRIAAVLVLASAMTTGFAAAADRKPLPAFTVVAANGARVAGDRLIASDRWLVIYVTPACVPCDRILRALDGWALSQLAQRTVVIVGSAGGADIGDASAVRSSLGPALATMPIFLDNDGSAARALGIAERPALVGVETGQIDWIIQGVLNDPESVKSLVETWVER